MFEKRLTRQERRAGIARENAMHWATRTAECGEDPTAILARAQLYEDYILGKETRLPEARIVKACTSS